MHPDAEVRLPAETVYVAVLRMAASGIAARLDFTLDEVEDLRMAVSEACSMVLADATPGGSMTGRFFLGQGRLDVEITADSERATPPDPDSFGWQVLSTTAAEASAALTGNELVISLTVNSSTSSAPA